MASLSMSAEQKIASTSLTRIPKALIGTKWIFENGYRAENRTIEFISATKVKYTIEDTKDNTGSLLLKRMIAISMLNLILS